LHELDDQGQKARKRQRVEISGVVNHHVSSSLGAMNMNWYHKRGKVEARTAVDSGSSLLCTQSC
jgi:hypothetical protein